jgi:ATP-binding cassette, subfamily B, bacterial
MPQTPSIVMPPETLPPQIADLLKSIVESDEKTLFVQKSDLTHELKFGTSWLVITNKRVAAFTGEKLHVTLKVSEIKKALIVELFSGGKLVVEAATGDRNLIYYSKVYIPEFAALCRIIGELAEGKEPVPPQAIEPAFCSKCKSPLPERGANCTACVQRMQVLYRLLGLLRPYRSKVILLVVSTFITVLANMGPPYITMKIVDEVIREERHDRLNLWIGALLACGIVTLASRLVSGTLTSWIGARLVTDLRSRLHAALQRLQMNYFQRRESGELVGRVMNDTGELQHFLTDGFPYLLVNIISFFVIAGILISLDHKLAMLVFVPVPFLLIGGKWFWTRLIPMYHKQGYRNGALHSILHESIYGIRIVKAFAQEKDRESKFDSTNEKLFGARCTVERTYLGFSELMFWIMTIGVTAVWYFGVRRIAGGDQNLSMGTLLAFVGYIWLFFGPLQWFTAVMNWMTHAFSGAERIFAVLDSAPETYDAPDAISVPEVKGAIAFKDVRFSYDRGKEVIKGISIDVKPGEMIGLVGKSGAGKSTIINLVSRFYDVDSGMITIDGHPIKKLKLQEFRRQLGIVPQDPFLFNASVLENIRYGRPLASFEDVVRAARAANAHDFIVDKEDGYDTIIGEKGTMLSGGEKQRIAIARAILHNPPILILDEATSAVDSETEKAIQDAIAFLIRGRTTIAIAHRLATLRNANRLIVIEDGKIAEQGTHDELLASEGVYAKLVKIQTDINRITSESVVWK